MSVAREVRRGEIAFILITLIFGAMIGGSLGIAKTMKAHTEQLDRIIIQVDELNNDLIKFNEKLVKRNKGE